MTKDYDFDTLHVCIDIHVLLEPSSVLGLLHIASVMGLLHIALFVQLHACQHAAGQRRVQNGNCEHSLESRQASVVDSSTMETLTPLCSTS